MNMCVVMCMYNSNNSNNNSNSIYYLSTILTNNYVYLYISIYIIISWQILWGFWVLFVIRVVSHLQQRSLMKMESLMHGLRPETQDACIAEARNTGLSTDLRGRWRKISELPLAATSQEYHL